MVVACVLETALQGQVLGSQWHHLPRGSLLESQPMPELAAPPWQGPLRALQALGARQVWVSSEAWLPPHPSLPLISASLQGWFSEKLP